jgi:ABC-type molybdenum transport system ATPase subunit/photorepair protein PhrA
VIDLGKEGKNLLVYGENGSGKNSISTSIVERQSLLKASGDIEIH